MAPIKPRECQFITKLRAPKARNFSSRGAPQARRIYPMTGWARRVSTSCKWRRHPQHRWITALTSDYYLQPRYLIKPSLINPLGQILLAEKSVNQWPLSHPLQGKRVLLNVGIQWHTRVGIGWNI